MLFTGIRRPCSALFGRYVRIRAVKCTVSVSKAVDYAMRGAIRDTISNSLTHTLIVTMLCSVLTASRIIMMTALAFAKRTAFFQFFFSSFTRSFIHLLRSNFANKLKKIQAECDVEEYCYDYCDFLPCNLPIVVTIKMKIQLRSWFRLTSGSFFIWRIFLSPMVTHFFFYFSMAFGIT